MHQPPPGKHQCNHSCYHCCFVKPTWPGMAMAKPDMTIRMSSIRAPMAMPLHHTCACKKHKKIPPQCPDLRHYYRLTWRGIVKPDMTIRMSRMRPPIELAAMPSRATWAMHLQQGRMRIRGSAQYRSKGARHRGLQWRQGRQRGRCIYGQTGRAGFRCIIPAVTYLLPVACLCCSL